jgi:hypothetical protein
VDFFQRTAMAGAIDEADLKLLLVTDAVEEAMAHIQKYAVEQFGLRPRKGPRRS